MSAKPFWADFDDEDIVPIPGGPLRVGDIRGDRKREDRAAVWLFLDVHAKEVMSAAYVSAMRESGETQLRMLTQAAVRVGLAVLDKFEQLQDDRRVLGARARAAKIADEHEERWGVWVREILGRDEKRSAERLAKALRNNAMVKKPPTLKEKSTFGRFVSEVRRDMKVRHLLSE